MVPHAHLDLSWLGTPSECEQINNGIIKSAVELLEAEPDYRYTVETVRPLEKFLAGNPGEGERVKRFFSEGRLEVGGMYVDVACDYCFDESLARNFCIGQKWLERTFGALTDIVREEDVSSHFAQMPQLLVKSGVRYLKLSRGPVGVFDGLRRKARKSSPPCSNTTIRTISASAGVPNSPSATCRDTCAGWRPKSNSRSRP